MRKILDCGCVERLLATCGVHCPEDDAVIVCPTKCRLQETEVTKPEFSGKVELGMLVEKIGHRQPAFQAVFRDRRPRTS